MVQGVEDINTPAAARFEALLERLRSNDPTLLTVPDGELDERGEQATAIESNGELERLAAALHGNTHCRTVHVDIINDSYDDDPEDDRVAGLLLEAMDHCAVQVVSFGEDVGVSDDMRAAFLDCACTSRLLRAVQEDDHVLPGLIDQCIPWGMMHPSAEHIRRLAEVLPENTHFEGLQIEAHRGLRQSDFDPLLLAIPQCTLECVAICGELEEGDQALRAKLATALLPNILQGHLDEDAVTAEARLLDFEDCYIRNEHIGLIGDTLAGDTSIKKIVGLRVGFRSDDDITPEAVEVLMKSIRDGDSYVYSVQVSGDSSMYMQIRTTEDEQARERKMKEAIQAVCAPRALALIAQDDDCVRQLIVDATWTARFDDAEAAKLATALETNTKLESLGIDEMSANELTDEGAGHLERVISSASSCAVSEVVFSLSPFNDSEDGISGMKVSIAKRTAIERQCLANGLRRLRANDRFQTVLTCTGRSGFGSKTAQGVAPAEAEPDLHQVEELASLLVRNAEQYQAAQPLRLNFRGNKQMTDRAGRVLLDALKHPNCHVQSLQLEWTSLSTEQERALYRQVSLNIQRYQQRTDSAEDHRPIQRLLLSALYKSDAPCFSLDVLSIVVEKLARTSVCPLMQADGSFRPEHAPVARSMYSALPRDFLWHVHQHSSAVTNGGPTEGSGNDVGVGASRGSDDEASSSRRRKRHKS